MAKKTKTQLPVVELSTFKLNILNSATALLEGSVPNRKVVKNTVKTLIGIAENQFVVDGFFSWEDKRAIMDKVFEKIS